MTFASKKETKNTAFSNYRPDSCSGEPSSPIQWEFSFDFILKLCLFTRPSSKQFINNQWFSCFKYSYAKRTLVTREIHYVVGNLIHLNIFMQWKLHYGYGLNNNTRKTWDICTILVKIIDLYTKSDEVSTQLIKLVTEGWWSLNKIDKTGYRRVMKSQHDCLLRSCLEHVITPCFIVIKQGNNRNNKQDNT